MCEEEEDVPAKLLDSSAGEEDDVGHGYAMTELSLALSFDGGDGYGGLAHLGGDREGRGDG